MANPNLSFSPGNGLPLSPKELSALSAASIQAHSTVSLAYQRKSQRWILRAEESGGGMVAIGHYVGFAGVGAEGLALSFQNQTLQPNSGHRLVFASNLVRFELFRYGTHCHLLISHHSVGPTKGEASEGKRPAHIRRNLLVEHWGHIQKNGDLLFLDRSGEAVDLPEYLKPYIACALAGTRCAACMHTHFEHLTSIQLPVPAPQPVPKPAAVPASTEGPPDQGPKHRKRKEPYTFPSNVPQDPSMEAVP